MPSRSTNVAIAGTSTLLMEEIFAPFEMENIPFFIAFHRQDGIYHVDLRLEIQMEKVTTKKNLPFNGGLKKIRWMPCP